MRVAHINTMEPSEEESFAIGTRATAANPDSINELRESQKRAKKEKK